MAMTRVFLLESRGPPHSILFDNRVVDFIILDVQLVLLLQVIITLRPFPVSNIRTHHKLEILLNGLVVDEHFPLEPLLVGVDDKGIFDVYQGDPEFFYLGYLGVVAVLCLDKKERADGPVVVCVGHLLRNYYQSIHVFGNRRVISEELPVDGLVMSRVQIIGRAHFEVVFLLRQEVVIQAGCAPSHLVQQVFALVVILRLILIAVRFPHARLKFISDSRLGEFPLEKARFDPTCSNLDVGPNENLCIHFLYDWVL